jgi:regulator of sigma E protease
MHDFLVSVVAFIVLIAIMVVVHEFGHFAVAKLCRVRVEAFSVGFGPRLFGVKYGETDYKVCLLPFGGFVKMTGENPGDETPSDDPGAFTNHPRWQRMLIGVAGPMANFVLAFVLMVFYFGVLNEVPDVKTASLDWVGADTAASRAGLQAGDVIQQFGSASSPDLNAVSDITEKSLGKTVPLTVLRKGQLISTSLPIPAVIDATKVSQTGMYLHTVDGPIVIDQVYPDTPAEHAGLRNEDEILSIDGIAFHSLGPFIDYLQQSHGRAITLSVRRAGALLPPVTVTPTLQDKSWRIGFIGGSAYDPPVKHRPLSLSESMSEAREYSLDGSLVVVDVLRKLVTHQASVKQLSGPIGIARAAGQAAKNKYWFTKFNLAAGISLNLGILNLLPFPILDGGLILLLLIESVLRHDISLVIKERIYQAAFVVLVMFFVYVSFNDIAKLSIFSHILKN